MWAFANRRDAGARLALELQGYAERPDVVVVAVPRGGIPVGYEIATRLGVPLIVLDANKRLQSGGIAQDVRDRTVIVSVDGIEHASSLFAPLAEVRRGAPDAIVAAIPVACGDTCAQLASLVDDLICLVASPRGIARSYGDFSPTPDREVHRLIRQARRALHGNTRW